MLNIKTIVCNQFQENCYIVSDETKEAVVIDCGALFQSEQRALLEYVKQEQLTLKHLIATHGHVDHHFGDALLWQEYQLKVEVPAADKPLMAKLNEQSMLFCGEALHTPMPLVGKYLQFTDVITFGSHLLTLIPTPGHTPGSVFFYCEEEGVVFTGDTLFKMSIGRTDFELGSFDDIMESLQRVKITLPKETVVYPGHGPQTTISEECRSNPYLR